MDSTSENFDAPRLHDATVVSLQLRGIYDLEIGLDHYGRTWSILIQSATPILVLGEGLVLPVVVSRCLIDPSQEVLSQNVSQEWIAANSEHLRSYGIENSWRMVVLASYGSPICIATQSRPQLIIRQDPAVREETQPQRPEVFLSAHQDLDPRDSFFEQIMQAE